MQGCSNPPVGNQQPQCAREAQIMAAIHNASRRNIRLIRCSASSLTATETYVLPSQNVLSLSDKRQFTREADRNTHFE